MALNQVLIRYKQKRAPDIIKYYCDINKTLSYFLRIKMLLSENRMKIQHDRKIKKKQDHSFVYWKINCLLSFTCIHLLANNIFRLPLLFVLLFLQPCDIASKLEPAS